MPDRLSELAALNAELSRELAERKQVERRMAVEHAVTRALAGAEQLEPAAVLILEAIGTGLGWSLGCFWVVGRERERLEPAAVWNAPEVDPGDFASRRWRSTFARGEGLPGRAWEGAVPAWV